MFRNKIFQLGLFAVFVSCAFAQEQLSQYLEIAAKKNPGLKAQYNYYLAALEEVPQVGSLPDPQLSFGYFIQPVETRVGPQQARFSLTQMFPWFGYLDARESVAIHKAKSQFELFEEAKSKLFYEVKSAYFNLYYLQKEIDITAENLLLLHTLSHLIRIKVQSGTASTLDYLRIEMEIGDLENRIRLMEDNLHIARTKFYHLLNINDDSPVMLPDTLWNKDLRMTKSEISDQINTTNHQLRNLDFKIQSYQEQQRVAARSGLPNISLGIDYIAIGESNNPLLDPEKDGKDAILFPRIGLSIPLYRDKYNARISQADLRQKAGEEEKKEQINDLGLFFEKSHYKYQKADREISLYINQSLFARKAVGILQSRYESGSSDFEELLNMHNKILGYSLKLEQARTEKQTAIANIYYLIGR